MTTPPPAAVKLATTVADLFYNSPYPNPSDEDIREAARLITSEFAPMVEALEKAIRLAGVAERNQDDEWERELKECEQALLNAKGEPEPYRPIPERIVVIMHKLSDEERLQIISSFCRHCGSTDTKCQCWNDE